MFKNDNMKIWRESFKAIIFVTLLLYLFKSIATADIYHGLVIPEDVYNQLPKVINYIRISIVESRDFIRPSVNPLSNNNPMISLMSTFIITPILSLLWAGIFVQYYKRIKYNEEITLNGTFVLFENNFLRNSLTVVLVNLATVVGLLLFIIPGLLLSLGLYTWPLLASERENDDKTAIEIMKMSWETSKGNKGFYFLTILKWGIISAVVQAIIIGISYVLFFPAGLLFIVLFSILAHIITSLLQGPPDLEIAQRAVYNGDLPYRDRDDLERDYIEVDIENQRDDEDFRI